MNSTKALFDIDSIITQLNKEISYIQYGDHPNELYEPIRYLMALNGKRLRPLLVILGNYLFSDTYLNDLKPAIAVEVFHNFTLMHDDIMDNAPLRRGMPTVHEKWNNNIAILSGDVMLVQAYDLFLNLPPEQLCKVLIAFNKCAAEVCEGQQTDMNFEKRELVSEKEYLEMIRQKTAVLLGFSLKLGGIMANAEQKELDLLQQLGENIGIGFQLKDDLLDVFGEKNKTGKQIGGDIIANKKTFLLIEAIEKANSEELKSLNHWLSLQEFDKDEKVNAITSIYEQLNIKFITENKIKDFFGKGYDCLYQLNANASKKEYLKNFIEKLIGRDS